MHTRISLNMYTYIFIASLRFLLCLLREKSLSRGRRVLRTPPHFCLSKVSAASFFHFISVNHCMPDGEGKKLSGKF